MIISLKGKAKMAVAVLGATSFLTVAAAGSTGPAGADPSFATAKQAVGSDTIQDVMDALAGQDAGVTYAAMQSSAATGSATVSSWDAIPLGGSGSAPGCITTVLGGASFDRPNGSSNGIVALSHSIDSANPNWYSEELTVGSKPLNPAGTSCTGPTASGSGVNVSGYIQFSRSSRGPKNPVPSGTGALTFIPIGRDGVSFAYYDHNTGNLATLTSAQLTSLYSSASGTITVGADTVHACITQAGSGTTAFWEKALGVTDSQAQAASAASGCTANPSTLEENGGNSFWTYASTLAANNDAVVDFSAASWIAQANAAAVDRSATARTNKVDLGAIDSLGKPYSLSGTTLVPSSTFYSNTTYGRNVYVVAPTAKLSGLRSDPQMVNLFVGPSSQVCNATNQATINKFGFLSTPSLPCGDTSTQSKLYDTLNGTPTG